MSKIFALCLGVGFFTMGCGTDEKKDDASGPPKDFVQLKLWDDRSLYLQDQLFETGCNEFLAEFWIEKGRKDCKPVTVKTEYADDLAFETWTIQSGDKAVTHTGKKLSGEDSIEFDGAKYFCYRYSGNIYKGDDYPGYTYFTVFSSAPADKPADIDPEKVYGLALGEQEACDVLKK